MKTTREEYIKEAEAWLGCDMTAAGDDLGARAIASSINGLTNAVLALAARSGPDEQGTIEVHSTPPWPPCNKHHEVQHRDGLPKWCNACGWSHGALVEPQRYGKVEK